MFKSYYKFIDKETEEISYVRSTKAALKTIKKSLDRYQVMYVESKDQRPSLLYFSNLLFIDIFSKSQLAYCEQLFKDENVKFAYSSKRKFTSGIQSKYQYRQKILKAIKRFNSLEEKEQRIEVIATAKFNQSLHCGIDADSDTSLESFISLAIKDFKSKGAILKNESIIYL